MKPIWMKVLPYFKVSNTLGCKDSDKRLPFAERLRHLNKILKYYIMLRIYWFSTVLINYTKIIKQLLYIIWNNEEL